MKIGIITDIHEDAERLLKSIKLLEKQNCEFLVCLGDISGFDERFYSYQFTKNLDYCIDCIKVNCRVIIPGNHDLFHLRILPKYEIDFDFPYNWYEMNYTERKRLSNGKIWTYENDSLVKNINSLNDLLCDKHNSFIFETSDDRYFFSHSVSPDISGFLTRKPTKVGEYLAHFEELSNNKCNIGICGHLHPNGLLKISQKKVNKSKFSLSEIPKGEQIQYICPAIADGIQDNGYTILDTIDRTIESIPIRTPRHNSYIL